MEPRGAVGVYLPAEDRYIVHSPVQRAHPYRNEIAKVLKVAESKVRVICIDVGGSFGMKTPVFNEAPLALFASKLIGRPVKWISTRTEAFLSDAQARDNVTEAELALDKDGHFLAMRVKTIAAIGAYLQNNMPAFIFNAGTLAGVYRTPAMHVDITGVFTNTNPVRPYRGNGRPEAGYVIERMVDIAAAELGLDPAELRRRNYISPNQMPFKTALTFTYDCGEFEKNMDLALELADIKGFKQRRAESRKRGKLRGIGISNTIERAAAGGTEGAEVRFDRGGTATLFSGSVTAGQGHETVFKQLVCDRLGLNPDEVRYVQGDTDQVFYGEGTGGSRTSTMSSAAFYDGDRQGDRESQGHRRACAQGGCRRREFRRGRVLVAENQPHHDHQGSRHRRRQSGQDSGGDGAGPDRHRRLQSGPAELSRTAVTSARWKSTRKPAWSRSCATAWWTTSAPCSIRCCCTARSTAASRKAPARC